MQTLFIGKNLIFLPQIHSTNSYATHLLKNVNSPEGTVIHTAYQTQGKGQRGASWHAEQGLNLTCSVILKPVFLPIKNQFFLYQIVALACYDTITELMNSSQIDIKIKWPNDILVENKKVAGILIENSILNDQINWCVAGIGLNVNQVKFDSTLNASSLKMINGRHYELQTVLEVLCEHLEKYYLALINLKYEFIQSAYLSKLYGLNVFHDFEFQSQVRSLMVKGISKEGLLKLEDKNGQELIVDVKEAKMRYG